MQGLMMDTPLTLTSFFERARRLFPRKEIVTRSGPELRRTNYGDWASRTARLASALEKLGVRRGSRVATFAWNDARHLELYFAVPCMGAVLHPLNLRLGGEDIAFIANHAEDEVLFVDPSLLPAVEKLAPHLKTVRQYVVMADTVPAGVSLSPVVAYEELLRSGARDYAWPRLDENAAAAMCYTSGTTGHPKGVVYSHRSIYLHTLGISLADCFGLRESDTVHARGADVPRHGLGSSLRLRDAGGEDRDAGPAPPAPRPRRADAGGAGHDQRGRAHPLVGAAGPARHRALRPRGPAHPHRGRRGHAAGGHRGLREEARPARRPRLGDDRDLAPGQHQPAEEPSGRPSRSASVQGARQAGHSLPWGSRSVPWARTGARWPGTARAWASCRCGAPGWRPGTTATTAAPACFEGGWFRTGDIVTIDPEGFIQIADRSKDLIKSGGEWISSVDLENRLMAHPKVQEAAVIAVPHPKWQERPLACVVLRPGQASSRRSCSTTSAPTWPAGRCPTTWSWWTPSRRRAWARSTRRPCGPALPTHVLPAAAAEPPRD